MPSNGGNGSAPVLDFSTCSKAVFDDAVVTLGVERKQRRAANDLPKNPFTKGDGWYDVAPAMAHDALLLSSGNRQFSFTAVKAYAEDMASGDWMPTGEAIVFSGDEFDNGHHRMAAAYLGGHTFRTYVILSAPAFPNRFAYYDQNKRRSMADALHIAGWDGTGRVMASVISDLAIRYDAGKLGVMKQPRMRKPNPRQGVLYIDQHHELQDSARYVVANQADAMAVIQSKPAAVFFAHLVITLYGRPALEDFFRPLATGANLSEDSPILAVRNRLQLPEAPDQATPARGRLALLIKAFKMHQQGEVMPRSRGRIMTMTLPDPGQPFPRLEPEQANP